MYVTNPHPYTLPPGYSYPPMGMQNFVPYATAPFDPAALHMAQGDVITMNPLQAPVQEEFDPAQLVDSMLQHDDGDDVADNGNHTLECTDNNHSPSTATTNFTMEGESNTDVSTEQTTNSNTSHTSSVDLFAKDEMVNGTCTNTELELSDNYLSFLA